MPSSKVAPTPNNVALNPKLAKLWQSLEPLLTQALSACALEEPDDPLGFVIERLSEAHQKGRPSELKATRGTAVAFEPKDATGPLRSLADQVLREQREQLAAGTTEDDHATKLPAGLKDFTPLAKEPEIKEAAAGLHALELALVKAPSSEAARSELSAAVARLEEATSAKIKERAASLQDAQNLFHPGFACEKSGQSPIYGFRYHWEDKDEY